MTRLTMHFEDDTYGDVVVATHGVPLTFGQVQELMDKLCAYEDTGFTPEEIMEMKQTLSNNESLPKINVPAGSIDGWTIEGNSANL